MGWSIYPSALLAPQECSQKDFRRFKTEKVRLWRKDRLRNHLSVAGWGELS